MSGLDACWFRQISSRIAIGDTRRIEARHLIDERHGRAQQRHRERCAGAFTEPQIERQQRQCAASFDACANTQYSRTFGSSASAISKAEVAMKPSTSTVIRASAAARYA